MGRLKNIIPIIGVLSTYSKSWFGKDLLAGITVATILIPQGLAYAMLAGVAPIYGLYAGLVPLIIYSILGTSRHLSIGPVAISSLLILSGVSSISPPGSEEFLSLVILAGLLIGFAQLLLGLVKLGFLVNFISHPVMTGFTSAAAVIILSTQLRDALGIDIPRLDNVFERLYYTITHLLETNLIAVLFCLGAMVMIWAFKLIHKSIPGALIAIIIGTVLVYALKLNQEGLNIIGVVPEGLPAFQVPSFTLENIRALLPTVLTVTTIGIVESISIAKVLETKHQDYSINVDQELSALGISKMVGAFFQAIPSSGSFTRSAVNSNLNAKSTISSLISSLIVGLVLIFMTPLFYYLPSAVLAAIILMAVVGLFDIKEAIHLWKTHRNDFVMMLVTFLFTLALGIEEGVLIGVVLSIVSVLIKSSKPHIAILGWLPDTDDYRNIKRFDEAEEPEHTLIIRFDDQLYFANAGYFKDKLRKIVTSKKYAGLKYVLLDASNMHEIDSTGIKVLNDIIRDLESKGIQLHMCGVKGPVRDRLFRNNMMSRPERHHMNIKLAIAEIKGEEVEADRKRRTMQSNFRNNAS